MTPDDLNERLREAFAEATFGFVYGNVPDETAMVIECLAAHGLRVVDAGEPLSCENCGAPGVQEKGDWCEACLSRVGLAGDYDDASSNGRTPPFEGVNAGSTPAASTTDLREQVARELRELTGKSEDADVDRLLALMVGSGQWVPMDQHNHVFAEYEKAFYERDAALAKLDALTGDKAVEAACHAGVYWFKHLAWRENATVRHCMRAAIAAARESVCLKTPPSTRTPATTVTSATTVGTGRG